MITRIITQDSTYEVDLGNCLIRRVKGVNPPTPNQGEDGKWRSYVQLAIVDNSLMVVWGVDPSGDQVVVRRTWTSPIQATEGPPIPIHIEFLAEK